MRPCVNQTVVFEIWWKKIGSHWFGELAAAGGGWCPDVSKRSDKCETWRLLQGGAFKCKVLQSGNPWKTQLDVREISILFFAILLCVFGSKKIKSLEGWGHCARVAYAGATFFLRPSSVQFENSVKFLGWKRREPKVDWDEHFWPKLLRYLQLKHVVLFEQCHLARL